jgi:membrane protein DedA with SNARE-associated domain
MPTVLALLISYRYAVLIPLAILEGPIVAMIAGLLVHAGLFNFFIAYLILIMGDVISDTFSYYVGYVGGERFSWIKRRIAKSKLLTHHRQALVKVWDKHPFVTLILAKLAYGLTFPFLVSAGLIRFSYRRFISDVLAIATVQYLIFLGIGYAFGGLIAQATHFVDITFILVAVGVILVLVGYFVAGSYARRKVSELVPEDED